MTHKEFSAATAIAQSDCDIPSDNIMIFDGFALKEFKPVQCTLRDLAALVRWQCVQLNGEINTENLNEIWQFRQRFVVTGLGDHDIMDPDCAVDIMLGKVFLGDLANG